MNAHWHEFEEAVREIRSLEALDALAGWDAETYMPPKAADRRASQRAAVRGVIHEKLVGERLGRLLDDVSALSLDDAQAAEVRCVRRDRARESQLPHRFVTELAHTQGVAVEAWKVARKASDFSQFQPFLEKLIRLKREEADLRGHAGERYDPLLDSSEPGMTTARLAPIFARLRDGLTPLVARLTDRPPARRDFLTRDDWDTDAQYACSLEIIGAMGFDLEAGRLDRSVHPFCSGTSPNDVRLTTRLFRNDGSNGLFSALHEAGHGLYEQGLPDTGLAAAQHASMGLHESQSRLWENLVGRSRPYWTHRFPKLKARFPEALGDVSVDEWLGAINHVERTLIRVDADEVTYNLHILVRFELELGIVRGELEARDLPAAWNEKYARYLGLRPPDDARGVLQDIHWSFGEFGYFPTYAIGNMYAASLMGAAERALPTLWDDVARGDLLPLRTWLGEKIHRVGRTKDAEQIVRETTGEGLDERAFLAYLGRKYA